ncbi:hypothetical protein [Chryseobacterium takakiae]|uniref:Uncharacterized protein n=1 Tax=Chryseobacterium takakiae TaxID=1302685 RepID=A0A1M5A0F7_9FLAO|nr:hypothetical protein [Chryseobacterium takakiae]SHF23376.1 hypothetical protein SAMN05444408_111101 [Chryseobacterium takakiae]
MKLLLLSTVADTELSLKDYFPLIGSSIVIILFIIERILSYGIRKKERKTNWYYKVFIDPNIEKINSFFDNTKQTYVESSKEIKSYLTRPNILDYKSHEIGKFQTLKRDFENDILLPIISSYQEIGNSLTEELLNLEDVYAECMDKIHGDETYQNEFSKKLSERKAQFFKMLFKPINK